MTADPIMAVIKMEGKKRRQLTKSARAYRRSQERYASRKAKEAAQRGRA